MVVEKTAAVIKHTVFSRVVLGGDGDGIFRARSRLQESGFSVKRPDFNTLIVADVFEEDFSDLQEVIAHCNLNVRDFGKRTTVTEATKRPEKFYASKKEFVSELGAWYSTNNEEYPLLVLTNIWTEYDVSPKEELTEEDAEEVKLVAVNLVAPDSLPVPVTMTIDELKKYNPRPATKKNFEELDLPVPSSYEAPPLSETQK
jgi:hypothetical protein